MDKKLIFSSGCKDKRRRDGKEGSCHLRIFSILNLTSYKHCICVWNTWGENLTLSIRMYCNQKQRGNIFVFTHKYNFVIAERKANLKIGKYLRRSNLPLKDYIALFFFNPLPVKGGGGGVLFPYINTPPVISTINWHSLSPNILWSCLFSRDKDLIMRRIRIYFPARHFDL